jgi:uncharacterized spore protein YtfJ
MPLIQRRILQGQPIRVGQKEIIPEARVTSRLARSATVGTEGVWGWGGAWVHIRPTAVIERGPDGERRIPVQDETTRLLVGLAAGAVFVFFLAKIAERLATQQGGQS